MRLEDAVAARDPSCVVLTNDRLSQLPRKTGPAAVGGEGGMVTDVSAAVGRAVRLSCGFPYDAVGLTFFGPCPAHAPETSNAMPTNAALSTTITSTSSWGDAATLH